MNTPDLKRIVDTYIPITDDNFEKYITQLKTDLVPHIRKLQKDKIINWFCFLIHSCMSLSDKETHESCIHIRLSPAKNITTDDLIRALPIHFKDPEKIQLDEVEKIVISDIKNNDWENVWKLNGDASEFAFSLLENYENLTKYNVIQSLHLVSNPLHMGHQFWFRFKEGDIPVTGYKESAGKLSF